MPLGPGLLRDRRLAHCRAVSSFQVGLRTHRVSFLKPTCLYTRSCSYLTLLSLASLRLRTVRGLWFDRVLPFVVGVLGLRLRQLEFE